MQYHDNESLDKIYQAMTQLIFELNIDFNLFEKTIKKHLVMISYVHCETITRTALKTGIDRRLVSLILKQHKQYIKPSSLQLILQHLKKTTAKTNGLINKEGKKSLQTIVNRVAFGATTLHSVIAELIQQGCIEDFDKQIKLIMTTPESYQSDDLQLLSANILNCINDYIVNKHMKIMKNK